MNLIILCGGAGNRIQNLANQGIKGNDKKPPRLMSAISSLFLNLMARGNSI